MREKIVILDYGIGNIRSIKNALIKVGGNVEISRELEAIKKAGGLIIPGVGAFQQGMKNLRDYRLIEPIYQYIDIGRPVLGICLGMQMMLNSSEENGYFEGLGVIPGKVEKIKTVSPEEYRLPHIAWSEIYPTDIKLWDDNILDESHVNASFYFVHSYAANVSDPKDVLAIAKYGGADIPAVIRRGNVMGCQFHPEKSGEKGLAILANFLKLCS